MTIDDPELRELAALDAVGALDAADRTRLAGGLLAASAEVQREIAGLYDAAAAVSRALPLDAPSDEVRTRILAHAASSSAGPPPSIAQTAFQFIRRDEGWQAHSLPGIRLKILSVDEATGVATLLVMADPGTTYPAHHHSGPEGCYVLEGEVHVAGEVIGPGDFHLATANSDHEPLYTPTGATVLLVCAAADYL
jgi:anti-sigma factor ChrR (cupin superfamily)